MSKTKKIMIWIVSLLVGLVLVAILALYLFFPLEDVKAMAIEKGEAALGRPLEVATIDISIWGGLGVKLGQVAVGSPESFDDLKLLEAEEIDVKLQLWELINGNYVIDRLIVNGPIVRLRKQADGANNYTFAFDAPELASEETAEKLRKASPEQQAAAAVIAFDRLEINDGILVYRDDSSGSAIEGQNFSLTTALETPREGLYRSTGRLSVDSLKVTPASNLPDLNIELAYRLEYDLRQDILSVQEAKLTVNQIALSLEGIINNLSGSNSGQLQIRTGDLQLDQLIASLPESQKSSFEQVNIVGQATVEANVDWRTIGDSTELHYIGSAQLHDVSVTSPLAPGELVIRQTVLDLENDQARLTINEAAFDGRPLKGFLSIENFDDPVVSAELDGSIDLIFLQPFLPSEMEQTLTGLAQFDMTISGPMAHPAKMNYVGELVVENGSYSSPLLPEPIESFELSISLAPQAIRLEKFTAQFVSSDLTVRGRINNPFPYLLPFDLEDRGQAVQPDAELTVTSRTLNVDKLFPEAVPGSGAIETQGGEVVVGSVKMFPLPDITATGTITIDTVIYAGVELTQVKGKLSVVDRKIRVYEVTGNVYSGEVTGETTVNLSDFNNPKYSGAFKANQIEADGFVSRFTNMGGHLFGKLNMEGTYNASGWEPDAFVNSLTMNSVGSLEEGHLKTSGATNQLLSSLAEQTGQTFSEDQTLKKLWTNIRVENGRVHLDDLKLVLGNIGDITLGGSHGFNGTLDYTGSILLTEEMTAKLASQGGLVGGLVSLMTSGENKRLSLPIVAGGSVDKPSFKLDFSNLQPKAKDNLKDKAENLLKGLFK